MNRRKENQNGPASRSNQPSEKSIPGKRTVEYERRSKGAVNEDEQRKVVNTIEDNAQSPATTSNEDAQNTESENKDEETSNEWLEAPDDQNEINPRSPKVN